MPRFIPYQKVSKRDVNLQSITKYNKNSVSIDYNSAFDKRTFCSGPVFVEKAGLNYLM